MNNQRLVITVLAVSVLLIGGLAAWGSQRSADAPTPPEVELDEVDMSTSSPDATDEATSTSADYDGPRSLDEQSLNNNDMTNPDNPVATLQTNFGTIQIELYEDVMPITAGNFATLVEDGFYDGIKFHRVIDGFMVQGGDPNTKTDDVSSYGTGGPGYSIQDEFVDKDYLSNTRGTLSMANSGPNTGGSQFFINLVDNTMLDYNQPPAQSKHPVFGKVIDGMDVVDRIADVDTNARDLPTEDVVIEKATVTRG